MRPSVAFALVVALVGCSRQVQVGSARPDAAAASRLITSADQLLGAMHDRYAGKWYRTITFSQQTSFLRPDGTPSRVETWLEAGSIPGRLRIDLGDLAKGNGVIYRGDSVYSVQDGKIASRQAGRNPLLILGFDVYAQPPEKTLQQLSAERIDIRVLHIDSLNGRRMYVVGAAPGDSISSQFWIDAERMLFVRLIQSNPERTRTQDIRFDKYVAYGDAWVAEEVRVLVGGKMTFHEEYSNVRVNVALDDALFLPEMWRTIKHWSVR
jgi:hypothetical protein